MGITEKIIATVDRGILRPVIGNSFECLHLTDAGLAACKAREEAKEAAK